MKPLILLVSLVLSSMCVSAQCMLDQRVPIQRYPFKLKAVKAVSSATAREGDYVEFQTMEPIYSKKGIELFPKGTSIYGLVTRRKHRHFPLVSGKLELELEPLRTWNGELIGIGIARSGKIRRPLGSNRNVNRACDDPRNGCVAGRRNAQVSVAVAAVAAAGSAGVGSAIDDTSAKFIAVSGFFTIAEKVGELLNGTDAEILSDEIFDLHVLYETTVCPVPEPPSNDVPGKKPGKKN